VRPNLTGLLAGGRWGHVLLSLVLVVASGCGDDDDGPLAGDGPGADAPADAADDGAPTADAPGSLDELIAALPPVDNDQVVTMLDVERLVADAGLEPLPDEGRDPDEIDEARAAMSTDWAVTWLTGDWSTSRADEWLEGIGFGPSALARGAAIDAPPVRLTVVIGDLGVDSIVGAIQERAPDAATSEQGQWVLVDEADTEQGLDLEASWPLERTGRPLRYAVAPGTFVSSTTTELRDAAVAGLGGDATADTLLGSAGWSELAAVAADRGWYQVIAGGSDLVGGGGSGLPPSALLLAATLGVADGAPLPGLVFVYADADTAADAAAMLERRLEETDTPTGDAWIDVSPGAEVTISDSVVVIELPGAPPAIAQRSLLTRSDLLLTE
jgi:hypothetical protein